LESDGVYAPKQLTNAFRGAWVIVPQLILRVLRLASRLRAQVMEGKALFENLQRSTLKVCAVTPARQLVAQCSGGPTADSADPYRAQIPAWTPTYILVEPA